MYTLKDADAKLRHSQGFFQPRLEEVGVPLVVQSTYDMALKLNLTDWGLPFFYY